MRPVLSALVLHESWTEAIYSSTGLLATVASSPHLAHAPGWDKLVSAAAILLSLGLVAVFTAASYGLADSLRATL